jgi:hypothetical protein
MTSFCDITGKGELEACWSFRDSGGACEITINFIRAGGKSAIRTCGSSTVKSAPAPEDSGLTQRGVSFGERKFDRSRRDRENGNAVTLTVKHQFFTQPCMCKGLRSDTQARREIAKECNLERTEGAYT